MAEESMTSIAWHPSDPSGACLRYNSAGVPYEEFTCLYPTLGMTFTSFEKNYDPLPVRDWMRTHHHVPIIACILYGLFIHYGRQYFASRPAWNCRTALAVWNFVLSAFSALGVARLIPLLIHNYMHYTWRENFCIDPESNVGSGSIGLWPQLFVLSKFPELVDTFFIVVHKKPLIFLHWYHHVSVLLFCWQGYINNPPTAIIFCIMNYAVHAVMYFYYFLMAIHKKPKWFNAKWLTISQISQMAVGCAVTAVGCYILMVEKPAGCYLRPVSHIVPNLIMYGSYLYLFVLFFLGRYDIDVKRTSSIKKKAA